MSFWSIFKNLQLKELMLHLEAGQAVEQLSISDNVNDGNDLKVGSESSATGITKSKNRKKRGNK